MGEVAELRSTVSVPCPRCGALLTAVSKVDVTLVTEAIRNGLQVEPSEHTSFDLEGCRHAHELALDAPPLHGELWHPEEGDG